MGWRASTLGMLGRKEEDSALRAKRFSWIALGLALLALAALVVFALGHGVDTKVSPAGLVELETASAHLSTEDSYILDEANPHWGVLAASLNKDAALLTDRVNPRWNAVANYFGQDAGFTLDEVNPRWSIVADYFGKDAGFLLDEVDPRWSIVADYFGKDADFLLDEVNPRWSVVADYFAGEAATRAVHDRRHSGRDERPGAGFDRGSSHDTSPSFGPELRRRIADRTTEPVVATNIAQGSGQDCSPAPCLSSH